MADDEVAKTTRRVPIAVALAAAAVGAGAGVGIGALLWAGSGGGGGSGGSPSALSTTTTTAPKPLRGEAKHLEQLLASGTGQTYHATYTLSSSDPNTPGSVTVEVWHMPPLERQDSALQPSGGPVEHEEALQLSSGLVSCTQTGSRPWSCTAIGNASPSGPDAIVQQITGSLSGDAVTSQPTTIAGVSGTLYDLVNGSTKLSIAVSKDGLPLEVTDGTNTLKVSEIDHHVTRSMFTPPAPVASSTSST